MTSRGGVNRAAPDAGDSTDQGEPTTLMTNEAIVDLASQAKHDGPDSGEGVTRVLEVRKLSELVDLATFDGSTPLAPTAAPEPAVPAASAEQKKRLPAAVRTTMVSRGQVRRRPSQWQLSVGIAILSCGLCTYGLAQWFGGRAKPAAADTLVEVVAQPSAARITIEGGAPCTSPCRVTVPRSDRVGIIRVEAPGYEAYAVEVRMNTNVLVDAALEPAAKPSTSPQK